MFNKIENCLKSKFETKDLKKKLIFVLGWKLNIFNKDDLFNNFHIRKSISIVFLNWSRCENYKFHPLEDGKKIIGYKVTYLSVIGTLTYLVNCIQLDIVVHRGGSRTKLQIGFICRKQINLDIESIFFNTKKALNGLGLTTVPLDMSLVVHQLLEGIGPVFNIFFITQDVLLTWDYLFQKIRIFFSSICIYKLSLWSI